MTMTCCRTIILTFFAFLTLGKPSFAKTILLEAATDADRMAAIAEDAPNMGWAGSMQWQNIYSANPIDFKQGRSFLLSFPLEKIPQNHRIIKAELIFFVTSISGSEPRLYFWRLLNNWGAGASYQLRMLRPERLEWSSPGAKARSIDRAVRPTAILKIRGTGEHAVNLTEDVEIWCTGAAPNMGWLIAVEEPEATVRTPSPIYDPGLHWKLRITYEPE